MPRVAAFSLPLTWRRAGAVAGACLTVLLSACGGGDRAQDYRPSRVVSFGDENSMLVNFEGSFLNGAGGSTNRTIYGQAYSVNTAVSVGGIYCLDQTTTLCTSAQALSGVSDVNLASTNRYFLDAVNADDIFNTVSTIALGTADYAAVNNGPVKLSYNTAYVCSTNAVWHQYVAHAFGKGFNELCPSDSAGAVSYAAYGATVAQVAAQVAAHRGELGEGVLVTLMAGQHDILAAYEAVYGSSPTKTLAQAKADLQASAAQLATLVETVLATNAKLVLALTPDLGQSPLVWPSQAAGANQAGMAELSAAFNETVYTQVTRVNATNGRKLALVEPNLYTNPSTRSTSYVHNKGVCDPTKVKKPNGDAVTTTGNQAYQWVQYCTTQSLITDGSTSTYLWSDDVHFAPLGHQLIGATAAARAANQF